MEVTHVRVIVCAAAQRVQHQHHAAGHEDRCECRCQHILRSLRRRPLQRRHRGLDHLHRDLIFLLLDAGELELLGERDEDLLLHGQGARETLLPHAQVGGGDGAVEAVEVGERVLGALQQGLARLSWTG